MTASSNPQDAWDPLEGPWAWVALGLLALHAVLAWLLRDPGILTVQDDAHHLILAEALRDFQYRDLFRVDAPLHSRYPPGYPALLAVWEPLVGGRFDGLVALNIALSVGALALLYWGVARLWGPLMALAVLAPLAVSAHLLEVTGQVRSEALYLFLTMAALVALAGTKRRPGLLVAAGAAAIMAAVTRSIGIAIVGAVVVHWVLERRKVAAPTFIGASALTVGAWLLWTFRAPEQVVGRSYAADLTFDPAAGESPGLVWILVERVSRNIPDYAHPWLGYHLAVPNLRWTTVDNFIVALVLSGALVLGLVVLFRQWRAAALYLASYLAILLIWPWAMGRFLLPVIPLLLLAVLLGLRHGVEASAARLRSRREGPGSGRPWIARVTGSRAGWAAVLAFAFATTAWGSARSAAWIADRMECQRGSVPPQASCLWADQASYFEALTYIDQELPEDAVFLSAKSEPLFYYTRRLTAPIDLALAQSPDGFLPFLREYGTGFILLGSLQQAEIHRLPDLLEPNCRGLALEAEFPPRTYLFRLRELGEPEGDDGCAAVEASRTANVGRDFTRDP